MLASKSRTLSLTKQNKTNAILKTLYVKKVHSGGARSGNLEGEGAFKEQHAFWGGGGGR